MAPTPPSPPTPTDVAGDRGDGRAQGEPVDRVAAAGPAAARPAVFAALGLALVGVLAGVVAVDAWVGRLDAGAGEAAIDKLHVHDPRLGWTNRPDFVRGELSTDGFGLRKAPSPGSLDGSPPGRGEGVPDGRRARLLFLGDSRLFGAGVTDAEVWSAVLQARLDAQGVPAVVLNGAVNGYSATQACRRGLLLLPVLEPDLVVLVASPGWSLVDNSQAGDWVAVGDDFLPASIVERWPAELAAIPLALHRLLSASHIYQRRLAVDRVGGGVALGLRNFVLSRSAPEQAGEMIARATTALRELADAARARGATCLALLIPEVQMTNDRAWEQYLREKGASGAPALGTDRLEPLVLLQDLVEGAGWSVETLFDELLRMAGDEGRYFLAEADDHWSADGHAAIAAAVEARLRRAGRLERAVQRAAARR